MENEFTGTLEGQATDGQHEYSEVTAYRPAALVEFDSAVKRAEDINNPPVDADAQQGAGLGETAAAAIGAEWAVSSLPEVWEVLSRNQEAEVDLDHVVDSARIKEDAESIGATEPHQLEALADVLSETVNERQYLEALERYEQSMHRDKILASNGVGVDIAARVGAGILSPTTVTAIASGGYGGLFRILTTGGRAIRFAKGAAATGAAAAAQEKLSSMSQTTKTDLDVLIAGITGFTLGGTVNAVMKGSDPTPADLKATEILQQSLKRVDDDLTDAVEIAARGDLVEDAADAVDPAQSMGAAQVRGAVVNPSLNRTTELTERAVERQNSNVESMLDEADGVEEARDPLKMRFDVLGRLLRSPSRALRAVAANLAPEHIGFVNRKHVQGATAQELQEQYQARMLVSAKKAIEDNFKKWYADEMGQPWFKRELNRNTYGPQFGELVSNYVRGVPGNYSPHVVAAGDEVRKGLKTAIDDARKLGFFEGTADNANYIPRMLNDNSYQNARARFGETTMIEYIKGAIISGLRKSGREVTDEAGIGVIAKAYIKSLNNQAYRMEKGNGIGVNLDDIDEVRELLKDARRLGDPDAAKLTDDAIENILEGLKVRQDRSGKVASEKTRLRLDESYQLRAASGDVMKYGDIWETDVSFILENYSRNLSGAMALKEALGIKGNQSEVQRLMNEIREDMIDSGVPTPEIEGELDRLASLIKYVQGRPMFDQKPGAAADKVRRGSKALRAFNFSVYMVQSGFASVAELGLVVANAGLINMAKILPAVPQLVRGFKGKNLNNDALEFLEERIGVGADDILRPGWNRIDAYVPGDDIDPRARNWFEKSVDGASHVVGEYVSMLGPLTRITRRMFALSMMKRIEDWAIKGSRLSAKQQERLNDMGLTLEDLEGIKQAMRTHSITMKSGFRNRTFQIANMDAWEEASEAAGDGLFQKYLTAIQRETRRNIIEADPYSQPLWTNNEWGKVLGQFLSFAMNAHLKMTARGIDKRDADVAMGIIYAGMFAGIAVKAQDIINFREDDKEPTEKGGFLWRVIGRIGHMGMLPSAIDEGVRTASYATGGDGKGLFQATTSGRPSGLVAGNPTFQTLDNLKKTLTETAIDAAKGEDMSKGQIRAAQGLLPIIGRLYLIKGIFDEAVRDADY